MSKLLWRPYLTEFIADHKTRNTWDRDKITYEGVTIIVSHLKPIRAFLYRHENRQFSDDTKATYAIILIMNLSKNGHLIIRSNQWKKPLTQNYSLTQHNTSSVADFQLYNYATFSLLNIVILYLYAHHWNSTKNFNLANELSNTLRTNATLYSQLFRAYIERKMKSFVIVIITTYFILLFSIAAI